MTALASYCVEKHTSRKKCLLIFPYSGVFLFCRWPARSQDKMAIFSCFWGGSELGVDLMCILPAELLKGRLIGV